MLTQCPHCKARFQVSDEHKGEKVRCKKCEQPFELSEYVDSLSQSTVETQPPDTATTKPKKTWLATVLCLFFGPLGMFYFGWRPAIAAMLLFGGVSMSFHKYATTVTDAPPWVLPSVIFLWAYVGWRHAKGWNAQLQDGKSNYFNSFNSGVLSTLYLIWLNILISLPLVSLWAVIDGYMNSQLQAGIMFASLWLLVAFAWFWVGRNFIFSWCERAFGRLRTQQVNQNEKVTYSEKGRISKGVIILVFGFIALVVVIITMSTTQPRKSMIISIMWIPPMLEEFRDEGPYRPDIDDKQQLTYGLYYVWDGSRHKKPWWIICRIADGKWRVCEPANTDDFNVYSTENPLFNDEWINGGFHRIQRTRVQKFQHIVFGTEHKFKMERENLQKVQTLIKVQEKIEREGSDLFESMKSYINEHPNPPHFWPPSKEHYYNQLEKFKKQGLL